MVTRHEQSSLQPYRHLRALIDENIAKLESVKEGIQTELERLAATKRAGSPPAAKKLPKPAGKPPESLPAREPLSPPPTPAQWAADPYGRHQWRYWDGSRWTEHVANDGIEETDIVE